MKLHSLLTVSLLGFVLLPAPGRTVQADEFNKTSEQKQAEFAAFMETAKDIPKPKELWPLVKKDLVPADLKIISDEIVQSDTDPSKKLRKITANFNSLKFEGRTWEHPCVILTPADNSINMTPERKGKVVIVAAPGWMVFDAHVALYGEPIATRTGYPTMIMSSPGVHTDKPRIENIDIYSLSRMRKKTGKNYYDMNCQLAVSYIRAMDMMEEILGLDTVKAIIGGHSKCGRSATVAAAMDDRVASPIIMGNEGVFSMKKIPWHLSFHHAFFQEQVKVPVFYIGTTNEGGYKMFNVNLMQERLKRPMTVEMIPNYRHCNFDEKQYIDFMMWVAHIFDARPISKISDISFERRNNCNYYRAKIESKAKVQLVRVWYVYANNPQWSSLMWYDWFMRKTDGDYYETLIYGAKPDAFMIEVADKAMGYRGYVTSLPQKISDAPVVQRNSRRPPWAGYPDRFPKAD